MIKIKGWKKSFLCMGILFAGVAQGLGVPMLWAPSMICFVCSVILEEK